MQIALIADLHGNRTAVKALEKDLKRRGLNKIWCLGDLIGKGPHSDYTFDWAFANCELILKGNWDADVAIKKYERDWYYIEQLGDKRLEMLFNLPLEKRLRLSQKNIRLLHGRPTLDFPLKIQAEEYEFKELFDKDTHVVGYADIHRQGLRTLNCGMLFNTGSVGNALGVVQVEYVVLTGDENNEHSSLSLEFCTLNYDVQEALDDIPKNFPFAKPYIQEITTGRYINRASVLGNTRCGIIK
ncbi:MAG: metallophosphoesterase family protein [Eubacteriales bacterium]|nr:metallophosphoesterase family protein [Eubacteriales bacterium]